MKVAIICEFSGVVRRAFRARGHNAWSYDLLPSEDDSPYHIQGDVLNADISGFDLAICHPPCTNLAVSGALHFKRKLLQDPTIIYTSARFALQLWNLSIPKLALENPIGLLSNWKKPTQIIQPNMFGELERKATCLWLRGIPKLEPTRWIPKELCHTSVHHASPGPQRWAERSRTLQGIADAMAQQWGDYED